VKGFRAKGVGRKVDGEKVPTVGRELVVGKRREKNLALAVETVGKSPLAAVRTTGRPVGGTLLDGHAHFIAHRDVEECQSTSGPFNDRGES
jgi:hypothetical protein